MDTRILYHYAEFQRLGNLEKRQLLNELVKERLGIGCEVRIYRILTRLTFQTLRKKYEVSFAFTKDEIALAEILKELCLPPTTCHHWYYTTFEKIQPMQALKSECSACSFDNLCEHAISKEIMDKIEHKYEYRLVSRRLQQILVKIELFKDKLQGNWTDDEIRISLRRLVEKDYYRKNVKLIEKDDLVIQALQKSKIRAMTALKWFYAIKNSPELLKLAQQNKIMPDEVIEKSIINLKKDVEEDIHANCNVCQ